MSNHIDKIDDYLRNDLPPPEMETFHQQLASDPALQEEFNFQKAIVDGIKAHRKSQLKGRLQAIDLPASVHFWQTGMAKLMGGATLTVGLAVAGYFWLADTQVGEEPQAMVSSGGPKNIDLSEFSIPAAPAVVDVERVKPTKQILTADQVASPLELPVGAEKEVAENTPTETKTFNPDIAVPGDQSLVDEDSFTAPEVKNEVLTTAKNTQVSTALTVELAEEDTEELRYKYFDGKLSLYGRFGGSPYEIIEINRSGGREVFLYFRGGYYDLLPTSQPKLLSLLTDEDTISQLEILRQEK